ncbi:MAG: hypothetical protein AMXMBFR44_0420 [Candidatus Campbellbacteria bacterium]
MERLSLSSYVWKCILGSEAVYVICLLGGYVPLFRTPAAQQLHHDLFETLPGFVWGSASSILLGAVYMLVFAGIFGSYMVWMHNSSMRRV